MVDLDARRGSPLILYGELAPWWPLLSAPEDYEEEAAFYATALEEHCRTVPRTLLELGSGGGNNASHLKRAFAHLTLVDLSPGMLSVSRALNPECEHVTGDMRTVRLGRVFDCVFVHDAIVYARTLEDVRRVADTARAHCAAGGAALFAPDFVRETFRETTRHGGHDDGEGRGLRYLEWVWDPDPGDTTYRVEYALLLRERDGGVEARRDAHVEGLFATEDWTGCLAEAGFRPHVLRHRHSEVEHESVVLVGTVDP